MIHVLRALGPLVAALLLPAAAAAGCPEPSASLILHSCWGQTGASLLLLPEDLPLPLAEADEHMLIVTGGYTGRDERSGGRPAPVGFHMRRGELVGRDLARMDGILLIDEETGRLSLHRRDAVPLGGETYDLAPLDQRMEFARQAAARGVSVVQSHLLVIDGRVDTRAQDGAPLHRRRILFTDGSGFGVWQSAMPLTLHDAAEAVAREVAPGMAFNLDMGSFDFCLALGPRGEERRCGALGLGQPLDKLSNLLAFRRR